MLQSLNHAELASAVCLLAIGLIGLIILSIHFVNRINQIQNNAESFEEHFNKIYAIQQVKQDNLESWVKNIDSIILEPLYEEGTVVDFNHYAGELKGTIVKVYRLANTVEYDIQVDDNICKVSQNNITAWYE